MFKRPSVKSSKDSHPQDKNKNKNNQEMTLDHNNNWSVVSNQVIPYERTMKNSLPSSFVRFKERSLIETEKIRKSVSVSTKTSSLLPPLTIPHTFINPINYSLRSENISMSIPYDSGITMSYMDQDDTSHDFSWTRSRTRSFATSSTTSRLKAYASHSILQDLSAFCFFVGLIFPPVFLIGCIPPESRPLRDYIQRGRNNKDMNKDDDVNFGEVNWRYCCAIASIAGGSLVIFTFTVALYEIYKRW